VEADPGPEIAMGLSNRIRILAPVQAPEAKPFVTSFNLLSKWSNPENERIPLRYEFNCADCGVRVVQVSSKDDSWLADVLGTVPVGRLFQYLKVNLTRRHRCNGVLR
jgi:hypothetical protein